MSTSQDPVPSDGRRSPTRGLRGIVRSRSGSMTDTVAEALREAIIGGVLPPHTWLREDEVASSLEVSRTPVREALARLTDEGLTRRVPNRGTVVAPMSTDELITVYSVWEALEAMAARQAAARPNPALIAEMRRLDEATRHADPADLADDILEFHRLLRRASGNAFLERLLRQVEHAVRRFPISGATSSELQHTYGDHELIIDAIASGDPDAAHRAATAHMQRVRRLRVEELVRNLTS